MQKNAKNAKNIQNMQKNMQKSRICKNYARHARNMQEICKIYARNMQNMQKNMQKICSRPNQYAASPICRICKKYAKQICKLYLKYAVLSMPPIYKICTGDFSDGQLPSQSFSSSIFDVSNEALRSLSDSCIFC